LSSFHSFLCFLTFLSFPSGFTHSRSGNVGYPIGKPDAKPAKEFLNTSQLALYIFPGSPARRLPPKIPQQLCIFPDPRYIIVSGGMAISGLSPARAQKSGISGENLPRNAFTQLCIFGSDQTDPWWRGQDLTARQEPRT
jgi:hypothetical protein